MKKVIGFVGLAVLGFCSLGGAAENTYTKIEPKRGQTILVERGAVPGTVILTSDIRGLAQEGDNLFNGNAGMVLARCTTLVNEGVMKRDLSKNPIQKDEVLGFSCWPIN